MTVIGKLDPDLTGPPEEDGSDNNQPPEFPIGKLADLEAKISCQRWVVPVLPEQELECLLLSAIDLAQRGLDIENESCQRFYRDALITSFTKILTDDAVNSWKPNIHLYIYCNCQLLVKLITIKLSQDSLPLLELLSILFNPTVKFHVFNQSREPECSHLNLQGSDLFARQPVEARMPRGWLTDLINKFGQLGGFEKLKARFLSSPNAPSVSVMFALIRPFGLCSEYLTPATISQYFMSVIEKTLEIISGLSDDELKKEAKIEGKNDVISNIMRLSKLLVRRVPGQEEFLNKLELCKLQIILRLLQISSFNGKMNALNEINKVINSVSYNVHRHAAPLEEEDYLNAERMTKWLKENHVLEISLRDSLHQQQYVDRLEKIIRFIIKERALTLEDLDHIWAAQSGKHEVIVKNVHDLLAKLAWDFSPEQLDHLFECFQASWTNANKKQRERLLELIRRLAEDDKDGVMAHKVLTLFWNLAHADDVPNEIMDQLLAAHVKILDYSCSQDRDAQKSGWLDKCVEELKNNEKWVLPALKHIREICCLYEQNPQVNHAQRNNQVHYRQEIIEQLQNTHGLVILVSESLKNYIDKVRKMVSLNPNLDSATLIPDNRYCHELQVQERLNFLRFLLKDGQLWLCSPQAKQIWKCLAEDGAFPCDREACFKWFSKLMGEEPDLDPAINKEFFEENILQLDPTLLSESGMKCFERFFKAVNKMEKKLILKRRTLVMDDPDLIGMDYLWRVITNSADVIACRAIEIMREVTTNLGVRLKKNVHQFHDTFMSECLDRLRTHYDNVVLLMHQDLVTNLASSESERMMQRLKHEAVRMCRVMKVLHEYVAEYDLEFAHERTVFPLHRASLGKSLTLTIRPQIPPLFQRTPPTNSDDFEITTHSNENLGALRRDITRRIKLPSTMKLELSISMGDQRDPYQLVEDRKLLHQLPLRDKMLVQAKCVGPGSQNASSPESGSSDGSGGGVGISAGTLNGTCVEAEMKLPGVLLSRKGCASFFFQLSDLGCELSIAPLRDGARALLQLIPPDSATVAELDRLVADPEASFEEIFFNKSSAKVLYYIEVMYALLMPACDDQFATTCNTFQFSTFQLNFFISGHSSIVFDMLTKSSFLSNADIPTRRTALISVLKTCKLVLSVLGHVLARTSPSDAASLQAIFGPGVEPVVRTVALRIATQLYDQWSSLADTPFRQLFQLSTSYTTPSDDVIRANMRIAYGAAFGILAHPQSLGNDRGRLEGGGGSGGPSQDDITVCCEALCVLTLALALNKSFLEQEIKCEEGNQCVLAKLVVELVLGAESRVIRSTAAEQFLLMCVRGGQQFFNFLISLLFNHLNTTVIDYCANSNEYFLLLCRLLNYAHVSNFSVLNAEKLLEQEIEWLQKVRKTMREMGDIQEQEAVLEGHLSLAKELISFIPLDYKCKLGSDEQRGICFIRELIEDFLFPASKQMAQLLTTGEISLAPLDAVCYTSNTVTAAFELLIALCTNSLGNMKMLADMLMELFYSEREEPLTEWDYLPPLGPRPCKGFVGLKNAGATCYMNSVLQQLFMVDTIKVGLLSAEGATNDFNEDFTGDEGNFELDAPESDRTDGKLESRKDYNINILKQIQVIFGHLAFSQLQFYVPRGLWRHFRLQGEPVNLREQQDAVEFFMNLVESLDEALKALGQEQIMSKILGGSYSDQKICKECPHRYSKEEPFSVISVDIRNQSNLLDSLEQYVKGELLEGADAYHCDKCNKKVVTVKRLCVKKLPPVLAIQLKRFEYDYDRLCAIKFNDYFEFPRHLDMEPYTVTGLAKVEGELVDCDDIELSKEICTKYELTGIVVHSGQASGGHYYSFILHRLNDGTCKWYKFDDGEVTEWKMDDDEEMKSQCFGGEYMGEVYDQMLKRSSYRRQKRWWNAYMLFYTRFDAMPTKDSKTTIKMPVPIERGVRRQNIIFMHNRNQFCPEYFQFMKKLISCNSPALRQITDKVVDAAPAIDADGDADAAVGADADDESVETELSLISVQLASRFLFYVGFHTKKALRGPASDWYDILSQHLRPFRRVRNWFGHHVLFKYPNRFVEYLLASPSIEVRSTFMKILVFLAHFSLKDGPYLPLISLPRLTMSEPDSTLSDYLIRALLLLLDKEVAEHGRYFIHYFSFFHTYVMFGAQEKAQLLKHNVAEIFMLVALDELPGPTIKYQFAEWTKLHHVVSALVRCCNVSAKCQSADSPQEVLPNPYKEVPEYIMDVQPGVAELLFNKCGYMKKIIEDPAPNEESVKLLQFCSWENPRFSRCALSECLWLISYTYCQDIKYHLDLLLHLLMMEDSWQTHRIHNALLGVSGSSSEPKEGMLDLISRSRNHYQKRAYQCIKCLTALFSRSRMAYLLLNKNPEIRSKWLFCIKWLQEELERKPIYCTGGVGGWNSPTTAPPPSNDTTTGYFLERSNSARKVLEWALELSPHQEEKSAEDTTDEESAAESQSESVEANHVIQNQIGSQLSNLVNESHLQSKADNDEEILSQSTVAGDKDKNNKATDRIESAMAELSLEQSVLW